jgi:hypothetical protein
MSHTQFEMALPMAKDSNDLSMTHRYNMSICQLKSCIITISCSQIELLPYKGKN